MARQRIWTEHRDLAIVKPMGIGREAYLEHMTFEANHHPLFTEIFGPLVGLKEEWLEQGATPAELDFSAFRYRAEARGSVPVSTGWRGGRSVIVEENERVRIERDARGRLTKMIKGVATLSHPLEYPVSTMDDWLRLKPHYEFTEERFGADWERRAHELREAGRVVCVGIPGAFDEPRQLMGEEAVCVAYYEQPELIHDILNTIADTAFRVLDRVSATVPVDLLSVHEDLAGKSGPLAGPRQVREFFRPYFRRIWDMLADRGARLFDLDTDGNVDGILEELIDCGVNCMHPIEPAAGMDPVAVRERCGTRLAFYGGLDKFVLQQGEDAIVAELEAKLPPLVASGGCVPALDHRIPNGTPLAAYRFYIERAWEILEREAAKLG